MPAPVALPVSDTLGHAGALRGLAGVVHVVRGRSTPEAVADDVTTALCGDGQSERGCRVGGAGAVWSARARRSQRPGGCSDCSSGDARRDLLLLLVGRQARGRAWPNPAEAVLDYGCLEASKDAAITGSRVRLDVVVEDVHQYGGGVAVKPDGDLIGVHPRQRIPRQCPTATNTPSPYAPNRPSEPRRQAGRRLDHRSRQSRE